MKTRIVNVLTALVFFATSLFGETLRLPLDESSFVVMDVPESWRVQKHGADGILDVRITAGDKGDFMFLLTFFPNREGNGVSTREDLRKLTRERGEAALEGALQKSVTLIEVKTAGGVGFVFHVTDRNPEKGPGDYREAHQGSFLLGDYLAGVTLLTHTPDQVSVERGLAALSSLRIER